MKTLYISHCTEYEAGWGSKSDGVLIGKTVEAMKKRIDELYENESYEIFWRYTDPEEVKCDDKTYDEICALMNIVAEKRGVNQLLQ